MNKERKKRMEVLQSIPPVALIDHRYLADDKGQYPWLKMGTRKERRKRERDARRIAQQYNDHIRKLVASGARFPCDQVLRQLAIEYTHRYASSGAYTQPTSFNYFEPFLHLRKFPNSIAPYPELCSEHNHIFNSIDFFDYLTAEESNNFRIAQLSALPEAETFHFTINGDILDLTFLGPDQREFVISGFSFVRRGNSLHWFLVGGQVFTKDEWSLLCANQEDATLEHTAPWKLAFLQEAVAKTGGKVGAPVALEGTQTVRRTVLSGEMELTTAKHLGRCIMYEAQNTFLMFCDDPEILVGVDGEMATKIISSMRARIREAGSMWNLAEGLVQLPHYFEHRERLSEALLQKTGRRLSLSQRGGRGIGARFKVVPALEIVRDAHKVVRRVSLPHYATETEGHWRRLNAGSIGKDRFGNPVPGKTWINASSEWRAPEKSEPVIYVKDRIASAKLKISEITALAEAEDAARIAPAGEQPETVGELYVLRCAVMQEQIYKIGWTSGAASERAIELSRETGVPLSFVVVKSWRHPDASALETEVHMMLAPYRLNDRREFFRVEFEVIERTIEGVLRRATERLHSGKHPGS